MEEWILIVVPNIIPNGSPNNPFPPFPTKNQTEEHDCKWKLPRIIP